MLPGAGYWMALIWAGAVVLVIFGFARVRARLRRRLEERSSLDDDAIRTIERTGRLESDAGETLDLERIEDEERRFWEEEQWDEADEW